MWLNNKIGAMTTRRVRTVIKLIGFLLLFIGLYFTFCLFSFALERFVYDAKGQRDPFMPLVTSDGRMLKIDQDEKKDLLSLEGIIYDAYGASCAIVNGTVVKIGDSVESYQVLKIEEDKVVFIKDGQLSEIELKKEGE